MSALDDEMTRGRFFHEVMAGRKIREAAEIADVPPFSVLARMLGDASFCGAVREAERIGRDASSKRAT